MKHKMTAVVLAAALAATCLAGCGSKKAGTDTETPASGTETGIANPWSDTDAAGLVEATGISFDQPEDAQNVSYSVCADLGMAQMRYTDASGNEVTVRGQATTAAEDISGAYYDWTNEENHTVGSCMGKTMEVTDEGKTYKLCTWYDAVPGISYSVEVAGDNLDDLDIIQVAEVVYNPLQGEADGDSFDSAVGDWVCDYDQSTITITEDGSVSISLTRLCSLEGTVNSLEENLLEFQVTDPSDGEMVLEFDTASGELKVTDSSWDLLENGTTFTFEKGTAQAQEAGTEN